MVFAKYRLSDGRFLCGWPQPPSYDPATEGIEEYSEHLRPDMRLHRYDVTAPDKKRLATAQELAAFDSERADVKAAAQMDTPEAKMIKALAVWVAGKLGVQPATARSEILTIYKGLP